MSEIVFNKTYHGWESLQDWDRDLSESLDPDLNPDAMIIPRHFNGSIHVVITYQEQNDE